MFKITGKTIAQQLDEQRPDMPSTAGFAVNEIFSKMLSSAHTLSPDETDAVVLYKCRVQYLMANPQEISLSELTKASQTKEKESNAGEEYCKFMASFDTAPSIIINGEVVDKQ